MLQQYTVDFMFEKCTMYIELLHKLPVGCILIYVKIPTFIPFTTLCIMMLIPTAIILKADMEMHSYFICGRMWKNVLVQYTKCEL